MGLRSGLKEWVRKAGANALTFFGANPSQMLTNWAMGSDGQPGIVVNEATAFKYTVLYSCVTLIAGAEASLPLVTYRRSGKNGEIRERARDEYIYRILHDEFNPRMSSAVARETGMGHLLTWGNQYAQIVRNKSGTLVLEINPITPDLVDVRLDKQAKRILYDVYDRDTGEIAATLDMKDVLHVPALSFDGTTGYSPVQVMKSLLRAGMGQDSEAEKFVTSGIRPPGAIKFRDGKKFANTAEGIAYRNRFQEMHAGAEAQFRIMVLEDGAEWVRTGIDPESAQMLESREFTAAMVCGVYKVPPHLVGLIDKTTSWGTGIEQQIDGLIKFALLPWLVKKEAEYDRKLFGPGSDLYAKYILGALERADIQKRTEAFAKQAQMGAISVDEWRELEDRNPKPGGDVHYFPLNLGRVDEQGEDMPLPEQESAAENPPQPDKPADPR